MTLPENPETRVENYLGVMAGQSSASLPAQPESRMEQYLDHIATNPSGGGAWGSITGKLSNQTDLQNALDDLWDTDKGTTWEYGWKGTTPAYSQPVLNDVRPASINMIGGKTTVIEGELVNTVVTNVKSVKADTTVVAQIPIPTTIRDICPMYGASAGSAYNYINLGSNRYYQSVYSIDLGTLEWELQGSSENSRFVASITDVKKAASSSSVANIISGYFTSKSIDDVYAHAYDKSIAVHNTTAQVWAYDSAYSDAAAFKAAMSGVLLFYEGLFKSVQELPNIDNKIEVVAGGSIIFENTNNTQVPNEVLYATKTCVVRYSPQTLEEEDKEQARNNIGASDFSGNYNDLTNKPTAATTSADGLMSSTDKTKLDGIAAGAEVNVQSDWNETDTTADAYIANKPTIRNVPTSTVADVGKVLTVEADGTSDWETPTGGGTDTVNYLTFTAAQANSTVAMSVTGTPTKGQAFEYSTDRQTWQTFTPGTTTITLANIGNYVCFRGDNDKVSESNSIYYTFVITGLVWGSGSIMTLLDKSDVLRSLAGMNYCFSSMFHGCNSLLSAPILPATIISQFCYYKMFQGCTGLKYVQKELPAMELWRHTPSTTTEQNCYAYMFQGCTSLKCAPELPAKRLASRCYYYMFGGCTSLESAPYLPAYETENNCYESMFEGCSNLRYIRCSAKSILHNMNDMLKNTNSSIICIFDGLESQQLYDYNKTTWLGLQSVKRITSGTWSETKTINVAAWNTTTKTATANIYSLRLDSDTTQTAICSFTNNAIMKSAKPWFSCSTAGTLTIECQGDLPTEAVTVQVIMQEV